MTQSAFIVWCMGLSMLSALALVLMLLWMRHRSQLMLHRERLAAIEKGTALPSAGREPAPWSPRVYLLRGMIWSFTGAALIVSLFFVSWNTQRPPEPRPAQSMALEAQRV